LQAASWALLTLKDFGVADFSIIGEKPPSTGRFGGDVKNQMAHRPVIAVWLGGKVMTNGIFLDIQAESPFLNQKKGKYGGKSR
jgi:hypothetical protein